MKKVDAWLLFWSTFRIGEEVVIITDDDLVAWGKMSKVENTGIWLKNRPRSKAMFFKWDDIRFMAHDGFPVRKLMGADGSQSITKVDQEKIEKSFGTVKESIRNVLTSEYSKHPKMTSPDMTRAPRRIVFSDPFMIESVQMELFNPGIEWRPGGDWLYEETIQMRASDGANGLLWGLSTCHYLE